MQSRARRSVCQENIGRVVKAMNSYANLYETYPAGGKINSPEPDDWIHWQTQWRSLSDSAIARWIPGFKESNLRCPRDAKVKFRAYQFSYSMHGLCENRGRAQIQHPSTAALIVEEESPNDGYFAEGSPGDKHASRHQGKGFIGFVDGHGELIAPNGLPKQQF